MAAHNLRTQIKCLYKLASMRKWQLFVEYENW